ncbi:sensor histidine kinase [Streptomyces synnematoformans]|uniref:histidine kinase n=1 Tax=Streptomyces synnematoformans TaxID=415721 RepID=A0ABN1ZJN9_9ACTN
MTPHRSPASSSGGAGPRRWRRHRGADVAAAALCYPVTLLLTLMPGGLEERDGGLVRSRTPSLVFRHFPGLLADEPDGVLAAVGTWPAGVLVCLVVPGSTAWAVLHRRTRPQLLPAVAMLWLLLFANLAPVAVALYSYAAWHTDRRRLAAWSAAAPAVYVLGLGGGAFTRSTLTACLVAGVLPVTLGLWTGTRRRLVATLRDRAARLEREQRLRAEAATTAERTRIAREMHDVVAHRVSLMVLQAGGLEVSAADPAVAESAEQIRSTGREALTELREVLGVLRDEDRDDTGAAPTRPQPLLADLDRLVADWRAAGMAVTCERTGDGAELPALLERTAYRVVQEALTNAGKHAPGGDVRIVLDQRPRALTVRVASGPAPPATGTRAGAGAAASRISGGYGLTGLRERVVLAGGELTAGPDPHAGWLVRATLPHAAAAEPGADRPAQPGGGGPAVDEERHR